MDNEYKIFCWSLSIPGVNMGDSGEYHYLKVIARSEQEAKDLAVIHNPKAKQFWEGPTYGGILRFKVVPIEPSVIEMS